MLVALPAVLWIALLVALALLAVVPLALHEHKSDSAAAARLADSTLLSLWPLCVCVCVCLWRTNFGGHTFFAITCARYTLTVSVDAARTDTYTI